MQIANSSKNYFKISLFGILIILSLVIYSFYYYHKVQKEKHYRFLKIIQNLKESKTSTNNNLQIDKTETQHKQIIDDEIIEKIVLGLKKIEQKEFPGFYQSINRSSDRGINRFS